MTIPLRQSWNWGSVNRCAVIREAMRVKGMAALGRIVLAKRERVIMLQSWDKGLMSTTLRYPYELRNSEDYFDNIPETNVPDELLQLAQHILETKAASFDPSQFVDHYEAAVVDMLRKKQAGMPTPKDRPSPPPHIVVNLMDALRRSGAEGSKTPNPKAQREMLLPIAGKGEKKAAPGSAGKP